MLKWTNIYCKDVKLLFKVDDDSFVHSTRFAKWLQKFEDTNSWPVNSVIGKLVNEYDAVNAWYMQCVISKV